VGAGRRRCGRLTPRDRRGYLLTQVIGGIAADRLGGKLVLGLGVVWWSVATVLTPMAAHISLPMLLATRALMGIGEGVAMPAMNNMLSRWVPSSERSRSLALVYSGMYVGSMLGLGVSPGIIAAYGWPSVFTIFGCLGIVWWLLWTFRASSTPSDDPTISAGELAYIKDNTAVSKVRALHGRSSSAGRLVGGSAGFRAAHFSHGFLAAAV
jgi:MFS transporter, ACS family, solute carrier family 17 (sodium-dependent inorganic phosphate cotransporter), other